MQFLGLATQKLAHLVEDDFHHVLPGGERVHDLGGQALLLHPRAKALHDLEVDVGLEQRKADLAYASVDVFLGQATLALQAGKDVLQFL